MLVCKTYCKAIESTWKEPDIETLWISLKNILINILQFHSSMFNWLLWQSSVIVSLVLIIETVVTSRNSWVRLIASPLSPPCSAVLGLRMTQLQFQHVLLLCNAMLMSETSLNCVLSSALVPRTVLGYFTQLQLLRHTDLFTQKAKIVIAALVLLVSPWTPLIPYLGLVGGIITKLLV